MNVQWPPAGVGWIIAILVLIFAVLLAVNVLPLNPVTVGLMLASLAIARLI